MVSLTTVYIVSVILTSIASIGSAFASNNLVGGSSNVDIPISEYPQEITSEVVPLANTEQIQPEVPLATA